MRQNAPHRPRFYGSDAVRGPAWPISSARMPHEAPEPGGTQRRGPLRLLLIALLAAGIGFSGWRGPYRSLVPREVQNGVAWDFGLVFSLSRAWIIGANPYELDGVSRAWKSSNGPPDADPSIRRSAGILVYPPTTLAVLSPIAAMPWRLASVLWIALNVACVALFLGVAARLAGLRGNALLGFWAAGV